MKRFGVIKAIKLMKLEKDGHKDQLKDISKCLSQSRNRSTDGRTWCGGLTVIRGAIKNAAKTTRKEGQGKMD